MTHMEAGLESTGVVGESKARVALGYWRALGGRWWLAVLTLALSVATAAFVTSRQERVFQSSAMMVLAPSTLVQSNTELLKSLEALERRTIVATLARIPASPDTRAAVAERLGPDSNDVRRYSIRGSVLPNTNIIRVEVSGPDAERSADIANAAAAETRRRARRIYKIYAMRELAQAVPRSRPIFPDVQRNYLVAAILGLVVGLGAVYAIERLKHAEGTDTSR